jgi:uncharacterized membrane protein
MISMFMEKDCDGRHTSCWSMTRVVAFISALVLNGVLFTMAKNNHVHDIAWPFCVMFVVTLLAVPIQNLFKMIHAWLNTIQGKKLVNSLIEKAVVAIGITPSPTVTTTTEIKPGGTDAGT